MPRDPEQPGPHAGSAAERFEIAKRGKEHLLLHVLGEHGVPQRFAAVSIYRGSVWSHQTTWRTGHIVIGDKTDGCSTCVVTAIGRRALAHSPRAVHRRCRDDCTRSGNRGTMRVSPWAWF